MKTRGEDGRGIFQLVTCSRPRVKFALNTQGRPIIIRVRNANDESQTVETNGYIYLTFCYGILHVKSLHSSVAKTVNTTELLVDGVISFL